MALTPFDGELDSPAGLQSFTGKLDGESKDQDSALVRGTKNAWNSIKTGGALLTGDADLASQLAAERDSYRRANPGTKEGNELMKAWESGDGISGGISNVAGEISKDWREAPGVMAGIRETGKNLSAMGGGIVEQIPNMVAPMGGMLAGGAAGSMAGPIGTVGGAWAGATAGNTLVESGEQVDRALMAAGINPQDKAAVRDFLAKNGDTVLGQAGTKGAIIGAVDTATLGLGGALLRAPAKAAIERAVASGINPADNLAIKAAVNADPVYLASQKGVSALGRNATVAGLEPAGEFAGEYLGQGVATGDWDTKGAALEALSSLGQSGITFAGQKIYDAATSPLRKSAPKEQAPAAITPEDTAQMNALNADLGGAQFNYENIIPSEQKLLPPGVITVPNNAGGETVIDASAGPIQGAAVAAVTNSTIAEDIASGIPLKGYAPDQAKAELASRPDAERYEIRPHPVSGDRGRVAIVPKSAQALAEIDAKASAGNEAMARSEQLAAEEGARKQQAQVAKDIQAAQKQVIDLHRSAASIEKSITPSTPPQDAAIAREQAAELRSQAAAIQTQIQTARAAATQQATQGVRQRAEQNAPATEQALAQDAAQQELAPAVAQPLSETPANQAIAKQRTQHATQQAGVRAQQLAQEEVGDQPAPTVKVPRPMKVGGLRASRYSDEHLQAVVGNDSVPATSRRAAAAEIAWRQAEAEAAAQAEIAKSTGKASTRRAGESESDWLYRKAAEKNAAKAAQQMPSAPVSEVDAKDLEVVGRAVKTTGDLGLSIIREDAMPDMDKAGPKEVSKQSAIFMRHVAKLFGKEIVFVGGMNEDGFYQSGNKIYLSTKSNINQLRVLGHEMLHALKRQNRASYDKLLEAVGAIATDAQLKAQFKDYFALDAEMNQKTGAEIDAWLAEPKNREMILEEMMADLSGNRWAESSFWESVFTKIDAKYGSEQAKGIIAKLRLALVAALNKLMSLVKGGQFSVDARVSEHLESIREALATGFADYAKAVKDKQVSEGGVGEVKFSGKQTNIENLKKLMTDREKSKVGKRNAERIVELFNVMPSEKEMAAVAYAGKAKRGWYKNSANALTHLFGSEARRFAGLLAALSPQVSVEVNTRNALRMWANWDASGRPTDKPSIMRLLGQSVEGSSTEASVMGAWVNNSMDALTIQNLDNLTLSGPKVNSFMLNLVGNWEEVTNDAWVANYALVDQNLFSGTGKSKDGSDPGKGAGYLAMNVKTRMAAKILSKETGVTWAPAEVQETIWSWAKTMLETLDASGETRTAKQLMDDGVITDDLIAATPDFELLFRQEPYAGILRNAGMGSKLNSMPMPKHEDPGRAPFADEKRQSLLDEAARRIEFLQRQRRTNMQISWEAKPGRSTGILPNIFNAPLHIQQQYLADIFAEFDMLQVGKKLGIDMRRTLFGPSAWKGDVAAGAQTILQKIGIVADNMGSVKVDADSRKNLEVAASILGYVLNQEGVYWHYPIYRAPDNHAMYPTGVEVNFGRSLTTAEVAEFYGIVSRLAKHQDWAPANTPTGVRFLNFTSFNDNPAQQFDHAQFRAIIKRASGRLKSWADGAQLRDFTFDGDAIENNWKENPNGEDYRSRVGKAGRSDLLKWADDQLSPAIDRVNKRYADQYGWGPASRLERDAAATGATPDNFSARFSPARSDAAGNERAGGRDAAATGKLASYGQPSPGAVSVQGFHYSGTERKQLDGRYYGTGAKGREADRVFAADDKRLRERIYFYVDAGKGVTPEQGVGANGHTVNLNNLYDADKDGFVQLGVDPALRSNDEAWMNAFESAVIDAGFDGYLRDFGTQRAAVLIGRHSVPVTYVGTGKQTGAVNASEAQKPARRTDLPLGQMTGAEWKKLEPRATDLEDGKSYYRSDLKFSPARVQSENELPNQQPGNRTLDGAELKALRRAASRLEDPERGVTFRVTEDGQAIVTGPARFHIPDRFQRFAEENGLTFKAERGSARMRPNGEPERTRLGAMPENYRGDGALYAQEMRDNYDRTGLARFSPAREYISEIEGRIAKIKASDNQGGLSMVEANLANIKRGLAGETVRDEQGNLLAPNGRKSKLTEQQYLQVRTPAFRKWFGDWLSFHNAKNGNGVWTDGDRAVSKIVDENGEPLVVYHGTEKGGFTVMRPDRGDKHRSPMLFAAATRQTARTYSWKGDEIDLAQPEFAGAVARKIGNDWFVVQKSGDPSEAYNVYGELVDVEQAEGYVSKKEAEYFRDNELEQYLRDRGEVQTGIYSMFLNIRDPIERDFEGANWDGNTNDMFEVLGEDGDNIYADDGRRLMPQDEAEALAEQNEGAEVSSVEWIGETTNTVAEEAKQYGQDGAIIRSVEDDGGRYPGGVLRPDDVFVFFDSNQAKSATQNTGAFSQKNDDLRYSPPRWYFSPLEKAFESAPDKVFGQAPQVKLWLAGNKAKLGLKDDEIFWTGINDYLDLQGKAKVTKADVLAYLDGNGVQVQEVVKGDVDYGDVEAWWNDEGGANEETPFGELSTQEQRDAADRYADEVSRYDEDGTGTKYASYQLPGGTNYRELLLTLPAAQKPDITASQEEKDTWRTKADKEYRSAHWEEPNILAHIRMNDRTDADGNKVLFIEEVQSDWGQEGKKNGFGSNKALTDEQLARKKELQNYLRFAPVDTDGIEAIRSAQAEFDSLKPENKTPDAPFVTDTKAWLGLAVKRIMAYAAANGYEKVAFISGAQSADRYDLSKQVDSIAWRKNGAGSDKIVTIEMPQGTTELFINKDGMIGRTGRLLSDANGKQLDDVIGKEITEKVLSEDEGNLSGDGLKVGGLGMVAFYDRIVPQVVSDQLKKVGGKIELSVIGQPDPVKDINQFLGRWKSSSEALNAVVNNGVISARKNNQILDAVVESIPVNVVNVLSSNGISAKDFASNPKVYFDHLPANVRLAVANGFADALSLVGARARAGLRSAYEAGLDKEILPALKASDLSLDESIRIGGPSVFNQPGARGGHGFTASSSQGTGSRAEPAGFSRGLRGDEIIPAELTNFVKWHRGISSNYSGDNGILLQSSFTVTPKMSGPLPLFSTRRIVGDSGRQYDQTQRDFFKDVGRDIEQKNLVERTLDFLNKDFSKKMAVGLVDQFRGLRDLGDNGQAYMLARLSKGTAGAFDALLHHGKLSLKNGVYDADTSGGFVQRLGAPLNGELDDFLWYVAANRAEKLMPSDREHLFTPAHIAAGKSLANGTTNWDYTIQTGPQAGTVTRVRKEIFDDANRVFNEFQKNTLDMAEQSGLIDGTSRKYWESEFYVPFYRVSEEDNEFIGAKMGDALVRQQAFKKLKGGTDKLNSDLLSNTLLNFSHLIEASAKNRAAKASLGAAEQIGAAHKAQPGEKKTVWFMDNGQKVEYKVDDPYVMTAITSLEYAGMRNGIMDALSKFKHWLTIGVTASPAFKVRNLIRDSLQAIGTSNLSYNPIVNVREGFRQTKRDSQEYASALASGALIRFGTMLEGNESARTRQLIRSGVKDSTILNSEGKWQKFYGRVLEPGITAYNELGNRSEEINRAALYNQLIRQGKSHAEAALLARDLMDFSMQGSFNTVRFLTQVVPFMNARLQGMYKLGRASKDNPRKMAVVTGAVAMASIALMLAYEDDDEWKRREPWDRDNYWWFKVGGEEFRIPKPFELGAIASMAERGLEYMINDEMTGERFLKETRNLVLNQLAMNPVPQAVKPIIDLYANKDSFTGRPIESMSMQRLDPTMRYNSNTSMTARAASNAVGGALSPVQVDHLVRGYFSWIGAFVNGAADMAWRAMSDEPTKPTMDYWKFATQGIVQETDSAGSRYVTQVYEQAKELERAHATWKRLIKDGKVEEATAYREDHADELRRYKQVEAVKKIESNLNDRIHRIEISAIDPDLKKEQINNIKRMKEAAAKRISPGAY